MQGSAPAETLPFQTKLLSEDVLGLIGDSVICTDDAGRILLFNRAAEDSFGYSAKEVVGEHVDMLLPQRHRAQHTEQVRSFALGKGNSGRLMGHQREVSGRRKNGEEFPAEAVVSRHTVDGRTILTVVHRDITQRKELEQQRAAVSRELDHRIRNVLSVVSSLVSLSARSAASVDQLKDMLLGRLKGLAATQSFLGREARGGAGLSELLIAELAHYRSPEGTNVIIDGEPILLSKSAIQPLALILHELATNSAKYGAFSDPNGRVGITSQYVNARGERFISIEWQETGGPCVPQPSQQGFGTTLIKQMIERIFRGEVVFDYRPDGLLFRMTLPRAKVVQSTVI